MSKRFNLKLLDRLILPIFLVIGTKYISAFVFNLTLSLSWTFNFSDSQIFTLPFIQYSNLEDLIVANSLSSFIMSLVLAIGFIWTIFRFQHFHEYHIPPKVASSLHSRRMEFLIMEEADAHHQITVWFSLAWLIFIVVLLEFLAGSVVLFVLTTTFTIVFFLSAVAIFDVHKKVLLRRNNVDYGKDREYPEEYSSRKW